MAPPTSKPSHLPQRFFSFFSTQSHFLGEETPYLGHTCSSPPSLLQSYPSLTSWNPRRLPLFFLLALALHLSFFWLIDVQYPLPFLPTSPKAIVTLRHTPSSLEAGTSSDLHFWNRLQDPSLLILPQESLQPPPILHFSEKGPPAFSESIASEPLTFVPLLDLEKPWKALFPFDLPTLSTQVLPQLAPQPEPFPFLPISTPPTASQTTWELQGDLHTSSFVIPPELPSPSIKILTEEGVTTLHLGVDTSGRIVHVLVKESSGDSDIDQQAVAAVSRARFSPRHPRQEALEPLPFSSLSLFHYFPSNNEVRHSPLSPSLSSSSPSLRWGKIKIFWNLQSESPQPTAQP